MVVVCGAEAGGRVTGGGWAGGGQGAGQGVSLFNGSPGGMG